MMPRIQLTKRMQDHELLKCGHVLLLIWVPSWTHWSNILLYCNNSIVASSLGKQFSMSFFIYSNSLFIDLFAVKHVMEWLTLVANVVYLLHYGTYFRLSRKKVWGKIFKYCIGSPKKYSQKWYEGYMVLKGFGEYIWYCWTCGYARTGGWMMKPSISHMVHINGLSISFRE